MKRSWRQIVRNYDREFPHQVRLANSGGWRTDHTSAALRSVEPRSFAWWTEGSDVDGTLASVWGFQRLEDCIWFELWATSSGIDWTVRPEAQQEASLRLTNPDQNMGPPVPCGQRLLGALCSYRRLVFQSVGG